MARERYWESARRMAAVSVAVVAVIAASVGVTIWRYEVALSRSAAQLDARSETVLTATLVGLFWHEREAMREDLLTPSPTSLLAIRAVAEVRKLAERSVQSTESIAVIIAGVREETGATILATEQGARQAGEVGELMASTATMLEDSILATGQQKSAADQVDTAIQQIRESAGALAAEQAQWLATAERLDGLVEELEHTLRDDHSDSSPVALQPDDVTRALAATGPA